MHFFMLKKSKAINVGAHNVIYPDTTTVLIKL